MPKFTKIASIKSVTPTKTQVKKLAKPVVTAPVKAQAEKPTRPSVAARPAEVAAKKKSPKPITREPVSRKSEVGLEQRRHYVEVAAYFVAERHGFTPGREYEDWVAAEAEIDRLLAEGLLNT